MGYQNFKEIIKKYDVARTNRFEIEIPLPDRLVDITSGDITKSTDNRAFEVIKTFLGNNNEIVRGLSLMCEQTEFPSVQVATTETTKGGDTTKMPYGLLYPNHIFTFVVGGEMYEKNIMDEWINIIVNRNTNRMNYYNEYITDITIHQLNLQGTKTKSVVLKEAYPVSLYAMPLSNADKNNFHRLTVEFAYKKWFDVKDLNNDNPVEFLEDTALFPFVNDALNDPVTRAALDFLNNNGLNLTGEAANIYDQINTVIESATGESIVRLRNILNEIKGDTNANDRISSDDKANLIGLLDSLIGKVGG